MITVIFADKIIYHTVFRPVALPETHSFSFTGDFEELQVISGDNNRLNVVRFNVPNPKGVILYFHGNRDNLERWGSIASELTHYQYDVFVVDYSGYGKSMGTPSEKALLSDALAVCNYIIEHYCYLKMIYYGRSLGTGVAAWLSYVQPPDGLILETPYYSLEALILKYYPFYSLYENKLSYLKTKEFLKGHQFPVLMFHGTSDELIPLSEAKKLADSLASDYLRLYIIEDGTHQNLPEFAEYKEALKTFLK